ncbi:ribosome-binding factor A [Corallococcus sp. H22C18031201]|uniref:ribosome-binding factor A n=1 Tax=Citreicoccus inhibens TaxID=2849499 RepID=UPI000E70B98A|nr:ribosome-binding factor A [Citreicoccus inhibens]MBU8895640.1 ribosome-binding factor A [Citreicoccus inhibens]RJS20075.1 ribosome-binding factor A [Corallococcus sp. H22C18031201]
MSPSTPRRPRAPHRRSGSSLLKSQPFTARHLRVQSTLFHEVDLLFRSELSDPRLEGFALKSFELSPDGRLIRIGYTLHATRHEASSVEDALEGAQGYLRAQLAAHLNLKRVPYLRFVYLGTVPWSDDEDASDEDGDAS